MAERPVPIDLEDPAVARLLDRAAQLALVVAARGAKEQPPVEVPATVRPILRHHRLTTATRATLRRALDEDAAFRTRVADGLGDDADALVGPAGVLFLRRPEGWADEVAALAAVRAHAQAQQAEDAEERRAARRLRSVEERLAEAETDAAAALATADLARAEAADARRALRAAEDRATEVSAALARSEERADSAEAALALATERAAAATAALADVEHARAGLATELSEARAEILGLRSALREMSPPSEAPPAPVPPQPVDASEAIARAGRAAADLGEALAVAALLLADDHADDEGDGGAVGEGPVEGGRRDRGRRSARRQPAPLPPLVLEGSAEEADHLVRLSGVTILVDGYNTTLREWPGLDLSEQRRRLVDLLAGVAVRFGAHVEVVFDGAAVVDVAVPRPARRLVRVTFTDPDVEADDVIIDRVRHLSQPVVAVSDDRRVRAGARAGGANVLSVDQLLGAARRP